MRLRCAACVDSGTNTNPQPAVARLIHTFACDGQMVSQSCIKHGRALSLQTLRMGSLPDGYARKQDWGNIPTVVPHWSKNWTIPTCVHYSDQCRCNWQFYPVWCPVAKPPGQNFDNRVFETCRSCPLWLDCVLYVRPFPHILTPSAKLHLQQCIGEGMQNRGNG